VRKKYSKLHMNCVKNAACLHGSLIACIAALLLKEAGLAEPFLGRIESGISKKKKNAWLAVRVENSARG
jgi:hypothetical protein